MQRWPRNYPSIEIAGRTYWKNPEVDRYQIPFDELGDLRIGQVPRQSHLEILALPVPSEFNVELCAVNGSSDFEPSFFVYGGPHIECGTPEAAMQTLAKVRKRIPELMDHTPINPYTMPTETSVYCHFSLQFDDNPNARISDIADGISKKIRRLTEPLHQVFICHASEDKPVARRIARSLRSTDADVWLDEWEIRVGDSIVQKINEALSDASHIAVLLSQNSCPKPWVAKEWSAALMRQLADNSIRVLPVRLDDYPVPTILADINYADCRTDLRRGVAQLKAALMPKV